MLKSVDWNDFYALWENIFKKDFLSRYGKKRKKRLIRKLSEENLKRDFLERKRNFLVVKKEDCLVGFLLFKIKDNYSWASWIGINSRLRGQGIGSQLVEKWKNMCRRKGLKLVKLQTSIKESMKFYQKMGFGKTGLYHKEGLTFCVFEYKL